MIKYLIVFVTVFACISAAFAQEGAKTDSLFVGNINPRITAPRCGNSEIVLDGKLDEKAWQNAASCENFAEINPGDNTKCEVDTKALVTYDDDNLYFAFICYENDMSKLRANICDRDKIWNDDYVGVIIDTYRNNQKGYEIFCNPYGIQGDATWTPTAENDSYDLVFKSEAKIYKDKWIVEMAIPFREHPLPQQGKSGMGPSHNKNPSPREQDADVMGRNITR